MALSTKIMASLIAQHDSTLDLGSATYAPESARTIRLASGTAIDQADRLWTDRRTLTASSEDLLDLAGVLTDAFGATITFARIKALMVLGAAANPGQLIVGAATTNGVVGPFGAASHSVRVPPGGLFLIATPDLVAYPITAGTADILRVSNSSASASATYDITIVGASA